MTMHVFEVIKMVPPGDKKNYHSKLFQAIFNCINHPEIVLSLGKYLMKVSRNTCSQQEKNQQPA